MCFLVLLIDVMVAAVTLMAYLVFYMVVGVVVLLAGLVEFVTRER